jgi:transposase-like protein
MTKAEQARVVAWRLKILRYSQGEPRQVARTCRHFGISRTLFYRWKRRFEAHGEAGPGRPPADAAPVATGDATRGGE